MPSSRRAMVGQAGPGSLFVSFICLVLLASGLAGCSGKSGLAAMPPDSSIGREIRTRLQQDQELGSAGIRVSVVDGRATLSGVVPSKELMGRAIDIAGTAKGVASVTNNLEVQRPAP